MSRDRLPAPTRLGRVRVRVTDRERAISFYQNVLGMTQLPTDDADAAFAGEVGESGIVEIEVSPGARRGARRTTGLYHFAILLPDRVALAHTFHRLHGADWPLHGASDHGVSEALYLADPDGNGIEVYADKPREQWPTLGGELHMTTERLDLAGLLDEAGPDAIRAPRAMPAGTRLGHIHLHVSDLERAEKFYSDVLGFDVVTRRYPGALFMSAGGYHHHVAVNVWAGVGAPRPPAGAAGLIDFSIQIPGAAALESALERVRSGTSVEPVAVESAGQAGWRVEDPDGNGVVLVQAD